MHHIKIHTKKNLKERKDWHNLIDHNIILYENFLITSITV